MCKKGSCILPIILLVIIAALCIYIFTSTDCKCKDNNSQQTTTQDIKYTNKDIAGYYTAEDKINSDSETVTIGYHLYLFENGTFRYQYVMNTIQSTLGNYTIVGNEIHLNYLFNGGSDASLTATNGSKILTINEDKTITDNNAFFASKGASKTIKLEKTTNSNTNINEYDVNYLINNYALFNKENSNN